MPPATCTSPTRNPHPQGLEWGDHHRGGKRRIQLRRQRPGHQRPIVLSRRRRRGWRPATSTSPTRKPAHPQGREWGNHHRGGQREAGYSGDNGPAVSAELYYPTGVAVNAAGNLYIADYGNSRVRKVSNGVITTVAERRNRGCGDNGPATSAQLYDPQGVAVDAAGNLYIADTGNNRIRKVSNGVITTVAGNGTRRLQRRQRPGHQRPVVLSPGHRRGCRRQPVHRRHVQQSDPQGLEWGDHHRGGKRDGRFTAATTARPPAPS